MFSKNLAGVALCNTHIFAAMLFDEARWLGPDLLWHQMGYLAKAVFINSVHHVGLVDRSHDRSLDGLSTPPATSRASFAPAVAGALREGQD